MAESTMDIDAIPPSSPPHMGALDSSPFPPFYEPQHSAFTSKSSSPPPTFSSDDSRESVDVTNYQSPRIHKNKRKGTWWDNRESAHTTPEVKKTKFCRNFDSGIYMHSDATDSSDDLQPQHKTPFALNISCSDTDDAIDVGDTHEERTAVGVSRYPMITISATERAFNDRLEEGLANNQEQWDFEDEDLGDRDIARIGDIKNVIRTPPVYDNELPTEGQFRSLEPELHIILNKNKLQRLTPALFGIEFLKSLSLRENQIEDLPQDICRLRNLQALDVSRNKLKHLPFDIVQLLRPYGSLERLTTMGNNLLEPMTCARFRNSDIPEERATLNDMDALSIDMVRDDAMKQLARLYENLEAYKDRDQAIWRIGYYEAWANSFDGGDDKQAAMENASARNHMRSTNFRQPVMENARARNRATSTGSPVSQLQQQRRKTTVGLRGNSYYSTPEYAIEEIDIVRLTNFPVSQLQQQQQQQRRKTAAGLRGNSYNSTPEYAIEELDDVRSTNFPVSQLQQQQQQRRKTTAGLRGSSYNSTPEYAIEELDDAESSLSARECDVEEDIGLYPHHPALNLRDLDDPDVMAHAPRYIARTLVSYYDQGGAHFDKSSSLPSSEQDKYPILIETSRGTYGVPSTEWYKPASSSRVFPLLTSSLHQALRHASTDDIRNWVSGDGHYGVPREVEGFLRRADENSRGGYSAFRQCHVCSREYVVARAKWVEFWSFGYGVFLPLEVSVCSFGCVPPQIMEKPKKLLEL